MKLTKKHKVLLVICNNKLHGTERYVVELARNLSKKLFEVYVATPETGEMSEILSKYNIKELVFYNGRMNLFTLAGAINLFKIMREYKFDIIHANAGIVPNILGKLLGVKMSIEIKHGILNTEEILENLPFRKKIQEWIKQFFVDYFIAICDNDKEKMVKYFSVAKKKIKVIYNGIDALALFPYRKMLNLEEESSKTFITIGSIGRITFQKGYDILIEAFDKLTAVRQNVRLIIIGTGEDLQNIRNLVEMKGLTKKVTLTGYKTNVFEYLRMFDVFVLTSRYEGVPYVILEAMSIGIPIISTKVGGIDNVLKDGKTGLLVQKNDVQGIFEAMLRLVDDAALRYKLALNAMEEVKNYSLSRMVEETSQLYLEVLARKGKC
ncbi:MAG: glycosyltransferase family 4 protein [Ignavibacteria bacterium]